MIKTAASSITIDDSKMRIDALLNRFIKSSVFVSSIVNVDVTVLVAGIHLTINPKANAFRSSREGAVSDLILQAT